MTEKIEKFEDMIVWQKSKELTLRIYKFSEGYRDFGFKGQIQRAAVSIMNNIAEGYERKTNKEFLTFLFIAKGSSAEVRSMLILANELEYISSSDYQELINMASMVSKMLSSFIKYLRIHS